jgi:uncharacterized protein YeeX (DUF496 family)
MKKIAILVASVLVLGGFSTRTYAAEINTQITQTTETVVSYKDEAGITPDSLLYTIDKAVDDLRVVLAGSEEKKAEVNADIAEERLGESEVMAEEGKPELAQEALEQYNDKISEAVENLQEAVTKAETTSEETTGDKVEQSISDLEKAIQEVQDKSLIVLDNLKDVLPKESTEAVEAVIEEQTAHKEAVAKFVAERHEFNAAKKSLNMAKVAVKKVEKDGSEESVKNAQAKLDAAKQEYVSAQTELQQAFQAKKASDAGAKEVKKEAVQAPSKETTPVVEAAAPTETVTTEAANKAVVKPVENAKTNNGNGNADKSVKPEEKTDKEKPAPVKPVEENAKSGQANGKNK